LALVVERWPDLSAEVRAQIIKLVNEAPATSATKLRAPKQQAPAKPAKPTRQTGKPKPPI
jgi:hypothetical protein